MTAVNVTSILFALVAVAGLPGCGQDTSPQSAASKSVFVDDMFDGVFVSKSFECVKGDVRMPIETNGEVRRTITVVNDHLLVTDANARGYLLGQTEKNSAKMIDVVSRYYEVKERSATELTSIRLDLVEPSGHNLVYRVRNILEGRPILESAFHPISGALRSAASTTWNYSFKDFKLHLATADTPETVCPGGGTLQIVFENLLSEKK